MGQLCHSDQVVAGVAVDRAERRPLARPVIMDGSDPAVIRELPDQELAFAIGVRVRRMGDLETEPREREPDILRGGAHPHGTLAIRWSGGREPESRGVEGLLRALDGDPPKANVVALARAIID